MKLGIPNLTNTEKSILSTLRRGGVITTGQIVMALYPQTRQFDVKCRTFQRRLRRLERIGKVRCVNAIVVPDNQTLWMKA